VSNQLTENAVMKKTLSFAIVHFTVAFTLAWVLTGSLLVGGILALVEPVLNTVAFHFHEKIWNAWERARMSRTVLA
jgi:uncharacterized membrane protein